MTTRAQMGIDSHGHVWLAWMDGASTKPGVSLKLVQVDPVTLAPLSHKTIDHVLFYSSPLGASEPGHGERAAEKNKDEPTATRGRMPTDDFPAPDRSKERRMKKRFVITGIVFATLLLTLFGVVIGTRRRPAWT